LAAAAALAMAFSGCRDMGPRTPEWVASAPEKAIIGVSLHMGWALERPEVRRAMARHPIFEQTLEILLDKVRLDPASETGRVSLYMLGVPGHGHGIASFEDFSGMALMQVAGFGDTRAVQRVIAGNFPPEGSLSAGGREYPLFVFFDFNDVHIRILIDGDGRLWIGDIAVLHCVARRQFVGEGGPLAHAAKWIKASGAVQGFLRPDLVPKEAMKEFAAAVPAGIKGIAWSISALEKDAGAISLSLAAAGTEEAIAGLKPWMQRTAAMASGLAGEGAAPPETLHEKDRAGLKCQFKLEHIDNALALIDFGPGAKE